MHLGKKNSEYTYNWGGCQFEKTEEKDVGVIIAKNFKPSLKCAQAAKKTNQVLTIGESSHLHR